MESATTVQEPQGIPFFSIRTGETHWGKLEPTISAYINSSDMGINASRDQDYGWRLHPDWVKKVRDFKRNRTSMSILTQKNDGRPPTTTQILYFMYGEELANYYESLEENENPFEEQYLAAINSGVSTTEAAERAGMPKALADFNAITTGSEDEDNDVADLIDNTVNDEEDEQPVNSTDTTDSDQSKPTEKKKRGRPPKSTTQK